MNENKKGSKNNKLTCDVCKINFVSNADYALHEFSKKHCDNLIRLAKHKPIISKQKNKTETQQLEKEAPKFNTVKHTGSFAKYGYFVPGEIYTAGEISREYNTEYDPYLQKFPEKPYKEEATPVGESQPVPTTHPSGVGFNKKKKKKIKTCQICNVTLPTTPEYEAHMKSPQHIWKLKITGMGVSAHFVKASTDLHTTELSEDSKPGDQSEESTSVNSSLVNTTVDTNHSSEPFPLLYCSDCELLLNSPQQYNAHVSGKSHMECEQRKAELKTKKEKLQNPTGNKLYCYSCKITLNNLFQYNEHKNGKKHKAKCKQLMKRGITIPPEERVPDLIIPKINPNKPIIYPELYEKFVLEKQKDETESMPDNRNEDDQPPGVPTARISQEIHSCDTCSLKFPTVSEFNDHIQTKEHIDLSLSLCNMANPPVQLSNMEIQDEKNSAIIDTEQFRQNSLNSSDVTPNNFSSTVNEITSSSNPLPLENESFNSAASNEKLKNGSFFVSQITIVTDDKPVGCAICNINFDYQAQFDKHLGTEDHFKKILELKLNKCSESDILNIIFSDRNHVKPDNLGRLTCSICNVTTVNRAEFEQHLTSIFHKYTQKDYKRKRTIEVKHLGPSNEQGLYFCKLCNESWNSLLGFAQHLHSVRHKSTQKAERVKKVLGKRKTFLEKRGPMESLKRKKLARQLKTEKNPGVRTKVCGVATDLSTGAQAPVPNLEPLEPNIDSIKNIQLGVNEQPNSKAPASESESHLTKKRRILQPSQIHPKDIPPLIPSCANIPPLMPHPPFQPRPQYLRPNYFPPNRNWFPYSSPYPPPFGPICGRPPGMGPGPRGSWFHQSRRPRY